MVRGSCLCGEVRFEVERFAGRFDLCHCSRCPKTLAPQRILCELIELRRS